MMHLPFAYIGPGAGFAFLGSFLTLLLSLLASALSILVWPFRMLWAVLRRGRGMRAARVRRVILLCLDGLDAEVTEELMAEGKLPGLARLKEQGSYRRLRAAGWRTFATGARVSGSLERESFWKILGRHAVSSTILRVPAGGQLDPFDGRILAADASAGGRRFWSFMRNIRETECEGGTRHPLIEVGDCLEGQLGENLKFRIRDFLTSPSLEIGDETHPLTPHVFTPWISVKPGGVRGIVRFLATGTGEDFSLYLTAMQRDPEHPEAPISYPRRYGVYLAKLLGPFATVPQAGDEAAWRAGAIDAEDVLMQVKLAQNERERMFFSALEHQPSGVVACGFDTPGRIHQIFDEYDEVIEWAYREMDRLVGRTLQLAEAGTAVFVLSGSLLFADQKVDADAAGLEDIAPTVLGLFGIQPPEWMEGRPVISFA